MSFHERFANYFQTKQHDFSHRAQQYLHGLVQSRKKNMERMAEVVPNADAQSLQHFLSNADWDHRAVVDQVARDADRHLGGQANSALYLDETGFLKKGSHSVGVQRQWIGRFGKVDNCQVGVFAALGCHERVLPINFRLYLPKEWVTDRKRCRKADVPKEQRVFKRKHDLALEMVQEAHRQGVRFSWVGADGLYGEDPAWLRALEEMGEIFVVDVHKDQWIYPENPAPIVPAPKNSRGRKPSRLQAQTKGVRTDQWIKEQPNEAWERLILRDSTKGELEVEILHQRVWLWDGQEPSAHHWHMIIRRELDSPHKMKYSLSNAPAETSTQRLGYMQGQRYWVERSFQDAKGPCGMADYQVRVWRGWHHHMSLVMIAMLFLLEERMQNEQEIPLLSCADITTLLARFLPRRDITKKEVIRQLQVRHHHRQSAIDSAHKKI
jgi:FOG: Transposase